MIYFCCNEIKLFIEDPEEPVKYRDIFREYYIKMPKSNTIITMTYCPWCGVKLPKELRSEYFHILDKEYDLDISIADIKDNRLIPQEFKTDEWWKKRGL